MIITRMQYQWDRDTDQPDTKENQETELHNQKHLTFDKAQRQFNGEKIVFQKMAL